MSRKPRRTDLYAHVTSWARRLGRRYILVLLGAALLTALSISIMSGLRFNSDLADLLPQDHPDLQILRRIQAKYSTDTGFMVLLSKSYIYISDDQGAVHVHDGKRWQRQQLGAPLYALHGFSPAEIYAAGAGGRIYRYDGQRWTPMASGSKSTLRGLWGTARDRLYAVGDQGTLLRYDGKRWRQQPLAAAGALRAIAGSAAEAYIVGDGGLIYRLTTDGKVQAEPSGVKVDLHGVWAAGGGIAFAVGEAGTILRREAGGWRPLASPVRTLLRAVRGDGPQNVLAAGDGGVTVRWDGKKLWRGQTGGDAAFYSLGGTSPQDVWAAGSSCSIRRYDGEWYEGPINSSDGDEPRPWYALFVPQQEEECPATFTAVYRPRVDLTAAKELAPKIAAALEKSPLISRVEYRKPFRFFKDRALLFSEVADLERLRDEIAESLERETAKGTGLYIDLEEDRSSQQQEELVELFQKYEEQAGALGSSPWFLHPDEASLGLVVLPAKGVSDFEQLRKVKREIERLVEQSGYRQRDPQLRADVGGDAVGKIREYNSTIYDIFGTLWLPVTGIILVILIYFRRVLGLFLVMVPLGMSICWTAAVTTLLVGTLNYVTGFLFAVLFGLGIDYGLQLYSRYREGRRAGLGPEDAMNHVILDTGRATMTSAFTTAMALLTMTLTDFKGFSEFGLIAGIGVILALFSFILVLPAMILLAEKLHLLRLPVTRASASAEDTAPGQEPFRLPRLVLALSVLVTLAGAYGATQVRFEYDNRKLRPDRLQDESERRSKATYGRSFTPTLMVTESQEQLEAAVAAIRHNRDRLGEKSTVGRVVSLLDFVPLRQHEKKVVLEELRELLSDKRWNLVGDDVRRQVRLEELREMSQAETFTLGDLPPTVLRSFKGPGQGDIWLALIFHNVDLGHSLQARALKDEIGSFRGARLVHLPNVLPSGATALVEHDRAEIDCSEDQPSCLERARQALTSLRDAGKPVFSQVVPASTAYDEDLAVRGTLRGQLLALAAPGYLLRAEGGSAAVTASGTFHASSGELVLAEVVEVLLHDGRIAFFLALAAVFLFTLIDFRSFRFAALAVLPLIVGLLWTFGVMELIGLKLNMFNFVILPAMMGIGIDYGVHYVHRYRSEGEGHLGRVMRSLYWVIFFCGATTLMGFGNIALASHPGLKSLGQLAIIAVACVFFASTYTLPALIYTLERLWGITLHPTAAPGYGAEAPRVVLYATSYCPSCRLVQRYLSDRGITFSYIEVDTLAPADRQRAAKELVRSSGADTLPVTRIGDQHVIGFDPAALDQALERDED